MALRLDQPRLNHPSRYISLIRQEQEKLESQPAAGLDRNMLSTEPQSSLAHSRRVVDTSHWDVDSSQYAIPAQALDVVSTAQLEISSAERYNDKSWFDASTPVKWSNPSFREQTSNDYSSVGSQKLPEVTGFSNQDSPSSLAGSDQSTSLYYQTMHLETNCGRCGQPIPNRCGFDFGWPNERAKHLIYN
jgi:hypothetical protein